MALTQFKKSLGVAMLSCANQRFFGYFFRVRRQGVCGTFNLKWNHSDISFFQILGHLEGCAHPASPRREVHSKGHVLDYPSGSNEGAHSFGLY